MKRRNEWARLLEYVTGLVNQQLLLQNKYLAAETLAEIGKRLGAKPMKLPLVWRSQRRFWHGIVPRGPEVRRIEMAFLSRSALCRTRGYRADRADGRRELRLGL